MRPRSFTWDIAKGFNPRSAIPIPHCAASHRFLPDRATVVSLVHADNEAKLLPAVKCMLAYFEVAPAAAQ